MSSHNEKNAKQLLEKYESQLLHVFSKFFIRYIQDIKDLSDSTKEFQSILLKIPQWSNSKIDREYSKFLKFISKKYQIQSEQLLKIYNQIFILRIKIILFLFRKHTDFILNIPELHTFWYKCIKHISKYFYDHPKISDSNLIYKNVKYIIELLLQKYTPISDIIEEEYSTYEDNESENNQLDNNYSTDNYLETNPHIDPFIINKIEYNKQQSEQAKQHDEDEQAKQPEQNEQAEQAKQAEPVIRLRYLVDLENEFYKSPPKPISLPHHTSTSPQDDHKIISFVKN